MSPTIETPPPPAATDSPPPLEPGDHLTRAEFHRRYAAMPHLKNAELIDNIVYMSSPVRIKKHGKPHAKIVAWLGHYEAYTPGLELGDNTTVLLDDTSEPQPDALLRILPEQGGQSSDSEGDYIGGAPEFVAEVAASGASYDRHSKKRAYLRNGVREYLIWLVAENSIEWWELVDGEYRAHEPDADGIIRSRQFPGLWLDAAALLEHDGARVLECVGEGVRSPEHAEFIKSLAAAR